MSNNTAKLKDKIMNSYLPAWVVIVIVVFFTATGIFIGSRLSTNDDFEKTSDEIVAVNATTENQETTSSKPAIDKTQWNLILVNQWNSLPENYDPAIKYLDNGQGIDERAYSDLQDMMDDCRAAGLSPLICSSYRTLEKQKELFNNKINQYVSYGYSQEDAKKKAGELVAIPGTSEHQLGLALDIVDVSYQILDEKQENTDVQKWLMNHSWEYGFILRYPIDKSDITGISYEPWHYRYVGKKAAKEIYDAQICLEEYLK